MKSRNANGVERPTGTTPWYFRFRSSLIISLAVLLLIWPWWRLPLDLSTSLLGASLLALGIALRVGCIRQIGDAARKSSVPKAAQLVTWGPFGWIRNPIYVANMLVFAGFAALAGLAWALPVLLGLMWLQYHFTVRFEERFLADQFGDSYKQYCRETPRWIGLPRWKEPPGEFSRYPFRKLLKRERSFLLFQIPGGLVLVLFLRLVI